MPWSIHPPHLLLTALSKPDSTGTGFPFDPPISADWANAIIALCSMYIAWRTFRFSTKTYNEQQERNREQEVIQREKDREAALELERIRQRTSRLEWYRYVVRPELKDAHEAFGRLHQLKNRVRNLGSDLTDPEKNQLSTEYDQIVADLRNKLLERVLYIHKPTYDKLKRELDKMLGLINKALFDDELKLNRERTYEMWIGEAIRACQQCFFEILYEYQGEGIRNSVEPTPASAND